MTPRKRAIEFEIALFALLLNFPWEMSQMPLFDFPARPSVLETNVACFQASLGDAIMTVLSYWIAAAVRRDRNWTSHPSPRAWIAFLVPGLVLTILFEALATGPLHRWSYTEAMPVLPGLGTGLVPLAQWLVLPPVAVFLATRKRRQFEEGT